MASPTSLSGNLETSETTVTPSSISQPIVDEQLTRSFARLDYNFQSVIDLTTLEALPPAAKAREHKKAADSFASTGCNLFVHYVAPILDKRRGLLRASGRTKKKYPKTTVQLWQSLNSDEAFFWNQAAKELRLCMKQGILTQKGCLIHAGRLSERASYLIHAEVAVAQYLDLPLPEYLFHSPVKAKVTSACNPDHLRNGPSAISSELALSKLNLDGLDNAVQLTNQIKAVGGSLKANDDADYTKSISSGKQNSEDQRVTDSELLNTLPDPFEYEQNMMYGHFAHYDYNKVRQAEGKQQTAMLRQLADRFDKTGKLLFYYYVVPRLCKNSLSSSPWEYCYQRSRRNLEVLIGTRKGEMVRRVFQSEEGTR